MKFFNKRYDNWLNRRIPKTDSIILNSRNLFIFPSKNGFYFLMCCFILFLLGTNYQNNLILFLVFFLCSLMVTTLLLSYRNLANLTLVAAETEAQFAGQDCVFNIRLLQGETNREDIQFNFQHSDSQFQSILSEGRVTLYNHSTKRGLFKPGRITIKSSFPFGLYNVWTHVDFGLEVLLYPKPIEHKTQNSLHSDNKIADNFKKSVAGGDQFSTLKSYQHGESLKSVAWKQLAQGRGWLTKQFDQPVGDDLLLDINTLQHLPLENRLSYLCYQILELDKNYQRYSLLLGQLQIKMGSGSKHKNECLKQLALFNFKSTTKAENK